MSTLTEEQGLQAGDLMLRAQSMIALTALQFTQDDLDLMEQSLIELEDSMGPRQVLAELFGRSSFDQTDQNIKAKLPSLRTFIAMLREASKVPENSRLHVFGEEIWGDD